MPKLKDEKTRPEMALIELPIAEVPPATWGLHINTHLSPDQSVALRRVTRALDKRQATLSNGRRVCQPVRWAEVPARADLRGMKPIRAQDGSFLGIPRNGQVNGTAVDTSVLAVLEAYPIQTIVGATGRLLNFF